MSNIFKIYINKNNNITNLYLFIKELYLDKSNKLEENIEDLNKNYNNSSKFYNSSIFNKYFKLYFSELDISYFMDYNIEIHFIDETIYSDNTIENIKLKFIKNYNLYNISKISFEEIYLYGLTKSNYDSINIFNNISKNGLTITNNELKNYLININEQIYIYDKINKFNNFEEKSNYSFEDINIVDLKEINILTPLGQSYNGKYQFISNPYEFNNAEKLNVSINTNNYDILFESNIIANTLYVCLYSDLESNTKLKDNVLFQENLVKLYYPLLYSKNILNSNDLLANKTNLIKDSEKFIKSNNFIEKNNIQDLFASVKYNKFNKLDYSNSVEYINFNFKTNINYNLSLESLFKLITSNKERAFIKYNPGRRLDNIYRLYVDKESKFNKKIPYLSKSKIFKYAKLIGKKNTIALLIFDDDALFKKYVKEFILELDVNGIINIKIFFNNNVTIDIINNIVKLGLNPYIKEIQKYVNKDDKTIELFNTINDTNITILTINYNIIVNNIDNLNFLSKIKACIQYFFNIVVDKKSDEKEWVYKNVSNYNKMSDKNAFIIRLIKQNELPGKIIEELHDNFKLSLEGAKKEFEEIIKSFDIADNILSYKKLKIKDSPGFPVKITNINNNVIINITNIDNINYLELLSNIIESIFKLGLNTKLLDINVCNSKKIYEKQYIKEDEDKLKELNKKNTEDIDEDNEYDGEIKISEPIDLEDDESMNLLNILLGDDSDEDDEDDEDDDGDEDGDDKDKKDDKYKDDDEKIIEEDKQEIASISKIEKTKVSTKINKEIGDEYYEDYKDDEDDEDDYENDDEYDDEDYEKQGEDYKKNDKEDDDEYKDKSKTIDKDKTKDKDVKKKFKESTRGNPLLQKIAKYQPTLVYSKVYKPKGEKEELNKHYETYSRFCQLSRQPVLLTEKEKIELIDKNDENKKNFQDKILKYSTNPNENYYYICPNFWDLKNNKILTKKQVDSKEYGEIFSSKTNTGNIFELNKEFHNPGFLKKQFVKDDENNEFCLPCCFAKVKGDKECSMEKFHKKEPDIKYVLRENKFPLEQYKIGHLPVKISKFLQFDSNNCINNENTLLFKNLCLLRYGIENDYLNSFVACIADLYSKEILKKSKTITINEMKKVLCDTLSIDNFVTYNNGNLPNIFLSKNIDQEFLDSIVIKDEYNSSNFYNSIDKSNIDHMNLYKKIINAYENFKYYLKSNDYLIDYTYLWDIVCKPNKKLFPNGINLIILDMTSYDVTDNVKVICPKQSYSNEFIDPTKESLFLIKNNNYYEPIYIIKHDINYIIKPLITFKFIKDEVKFMSFKKIINAIKDKINENCIGKNDKEYNKNINLTNLINIVTKLKLNIKLQIINYENQVIGIVVYNSKMFDGYRFIPCYPSGINNTFDFKFMDDYSYIEYYSNYSNTVKFLQEIYELSNKSIATKPLYKIKKDELIVGIITNGNQFVMLKEPEMYINDDLEEINDNNYLIIDKTIQTKFSKDEERIKMISNIKLESGFYNSFRNTIIKLLQNYSNIKNKIKLQNIIDDISIIYFDKLNIVKELIENIISDHIIFAKYDKKILEKIKNISLCNEDNCNSDFCMNNEETNICNLVIPEYNLITNDKNKPIYLTKIADELLRFNNIKQLVFHNKYYTFTNIKYNINSNELIIFENNLLKDLFDSKLNLKNPLENYNTYDTIFNKKKSSKSVIHNLNINKLQPNIETLMISKDKKKLIDEKEELLKQKQKQEEQKQEEQKQQEEKEEEEKEEEEKEEEEKEEEEKEEEEKEEEEKEEEKKEEEEKEEEEKEEEQKQEEKQKEEEKEIKKLKIKQSIDKKLEELKSKKESQKEVSKIINEDTPVNDICKVYKKSTSEHEKLLKSCFNDKIYETFFTNISKQDDNKICSYELILYIINDHINNKKYNINDLKNILIKEYSTNDYCEAILIILRNYNKNKLMNNVITFINSKAYNKDNLKTMIPDIINNENYMLTFLDVYILSKHLNIPIIFICNGSINLKTIYKQFIVTNVNKIDNSYYFIKIPTIYIKGEKLYKLLHYSNKIKLNINNDINDNNNLRLKTSLNYEIENFEDTIFNIIKTTQLEQNKTKKL